MSFRYARRVADVSFVPASAPKLAVARDGAHAVLVDGGRAAAIRIADGETVCELVLPAGEVGWIGAASRLLVVGAADAHTDVRLIDPFGAESARWIAEIRLDGPMRLGGCNGSHALLLGSRGAAMVFSGPTDSTITPYQFLARVIPQVVGIAGTQFVVALPGTIEEWDPASRMPKRRLRLPKVAAITSLGGSERVLWMTTAQDPHRLDVLPLVNRGQPKAHELPEPIAAVSGHPSTDAVVCIGAETGRIYAIDLDGRSRPRVIALPGIDRAEAAALVVRGTALAVIAAQSSRPIAIVGIEGAREVETTAPSLPAIKKALTPVMRGSSLYEDTEPTTRARTVAEALRRSPVPVEESFADLDEAAERSVADRLRRQISAESPSARTITEALRRNSPPADPPAARTITEALRRQSEPPENRPMGAAPVEVPPSSIEEARRDALPPFRPARRVREATPIADEQLLPGDDLEQSLSVDTELVLPRQPTTTAWSEGASELMAKLASLRANRDGAPDAPLRSSWRDDAGAWARAVASGTFDRAAPTCAPIETLLARFEIPETLLPALVLLYGSHLAGMQGAAPMDVAKVLGRRWDEALGRGKLAELALATYTDSRVRLAPAIQRVLDDLPPKGELVGEPGVVGLLGPTVLVSREPIRVVGVRIVEQLGGAVLLGSYVDAVELALEARALGAIAVGRVDFTTIPHHPILIVVGDEAAAEQIDLPRFELAPASADHAT